MERLCFAYQFMKFMLLFSPLTQFIFTFFSLALFSLHFLLYLRKTIIYMKRHFELIYQNRTQNCLKTAFLTWEIFVVVGARDGANSAVRGRRHCDFKNKVLKSFTRCLEISFEKNLFSSIQSKILKTLNNFNIKLWKINVRKTWAIS